MDDDGGISDVAFHHVLPRLRWSFYGKARPTCSVGSSMLLFLYLALVLAHSPSLDMGRKAKATEQTYVRIPIAPGASMKDSDMSTEYPNHLLINARRMRPCAT